jgi:hypothetical protein
MECANFFFDDANNRLGIGGITSLVSRLHLFDNGSGTTPLHLTMQQSGSGDIQVQFLITGTSAWVIGVDNSDGDKFKIADANDSFASAKVTIDRSTGHVTLAGPLTTSSARINPPRVVTASGAVTIGSSDHIVVVNKSSGEATTVNLPSSPATGRTLVIKDGKGDAATNNITITPAAGTIDGAATLVISANYGSATLVYNGTQWNVV